MKIDRLLSIVILLLNRDRVSAVRLAEMFEVSVRTIYRDIDSINLAGIPIISYPGNRGGFGIAENYRLDSSVLSLKDMGTILSALKGIQNAMDDKDLDGVIEKIASLVPGRGTDAGTPHEDLFVVDVIPWGYRDRQKKVLKTIHSAVYQHRQLEFDYKNSKGETNRRTVEPMTIVFKGYAWYLFAYCRLRHDFRVFRLSRLKNVALPGKGFIRKQADYRAYMEPVQVAPNIDLHLRFHSSSQYIVEEYFTDSQIINIKNDRIDVHCSFPKDEWVYSFLLGFGDQVEVIGPDEVRNTLEKKLNKIQSLYKQP
jgi:predicted DNA-binding transcriptional regulator YafY